MEIFAVIVMIVAGVAVATFVLLAIALAKRTAEHEQQHAGIGVSRDQLAASLLFHVLVLGGAQPSDAMRAIRRGPGLAAPVTPGIDVPTWAERYAQIATPEQRAWLLETAVQLAVGHTPLIALRQYAALLDLSFALGFHTDALARLRERYHFDYIDPARAGRPREADRAGGGAPLFARERADRAELLRMLGLTGEPSRQEIITAYRRIVAEVHPDRVHDAAAEVREAAAARFIEITRAYEALLVTFDR